MASDTPKVLRCAIYTRKSSEEGLEQSFNSLDAQREACAAFILSQRHEGWVEVATHYDDGGFSGGSMNRPALGALMRDIDAGLVDSVVVYKVDRLTRALSDFAKIVDCFDAKKVSFVSVTQQFNTTTSMGRLTLNVLLSFAQFEREVTGERIRDKIAASKKKGMWMGGRIPMGYDLVDRKLVINEDEANGVRHIYQQYLKLGCVSALKADLDVRGVVSKVRVSRTGKTSGGAPYSRGALYELLQNRLYIGETNHKDRSYPGEHDAIVGTQLWGAVRDKLASNVQGRRTGHRQNAPSVLVGKAFTETGERLIPSHTVKGGKRYRYYVAAPGSKTKVSVPASDLEKLVFGRLYAFLESPRDIVDALSRDARADEQQTLIKAAERFLESSTPAERTNGSNRLASCLSRVVVAKQELTVRCSRASLRELLSGIVDSLNSLEPFLDFVVVAQRQRRGLQVRLVLPDESNAGQAKLTKPNVAFVKAVARGHSWYEKLTSGAGLSLADLAAGNAVNDRYASRILRCAFIAPDVVERLLEGDAMNEMTLDRLLASLPRAWTAQRRLVG